MKVTPVFQTRGGAAFSKTDRFGNKIVVIGGNCFQAALASVLDQPLDAVPDFVNDLILDDQWFTKVQDWMCRRHNIQIIWLGFPGGLYELDALPWRPAGVSLITGKSPRGHQHVCVAMDGEMVHDPWRDPETGDLGTGLVAVDGWYVFIPIVPIVP